MRHLHFKIERGTHGNIVAAAILADGDDTTDTFQDAIWQSICLDVAVTIGEVTMPACMWLDPEHWAEDWAEKLDIGYDAAPGAVHELLAAATTTGR